LKPLEFQPLANPVWTPPPSEEERLALYEKLFPHPTGKTNGERIKLNNFLNSWEQITENKWVLNIVANGTNCGLDPSIAQVFQAHQTGNVRMTEEEISQCSKLIKEWMSGMIIRKIGPINYKSWWTKRKRGQFVTKVFCIRQTAKKYRLICDYRPVNHWIKKEKFKLQTLERVLPLLPTGGYLTKVDIKDAYPHIEIRRDVRSHLRFVENGVLYEPNALLFGLSSAPRIFTKVMAEVIQYLHKIGIHVSAYLDDLVIWSETKMECQKNVITAVRTLQQLGFRINWKKTVLEPSMTMELLGWTINLKQMTISVPEEKVKKYTAKLKKIKRRKWVSLRESASVLGILNHMSHGMNHIKGLTADLQQLHNQVISRSGDYHRRIRLTSKIRRDLEELLDNLFEWNGVSFIMNTEDYIQKADSSGFGWGGNVTGPDGRLVRSRGIFTIETLQQICNQPRKLLKKALETQTLTKLIHISALEALAQFLNLRHAMTLHKLPLTGKTVLLMCDNMATVYAINKGGISKNHYLSEACSKLITWSRKNNVQIRAQWLPGKQNILADFDSRQKWDAQDWMLNPKLFQLIDQRWGKHTMDLFASGLNKQIPRFCSWKTDPEAEIVNAYSIRWDSRDENFWINPPFSQIARVIQKIRAEQATVTLLAPIWRHQNWYPDLLGLLIELPVRLCHQKETFLGAKTMQSAGKRSPFWKHTGAFRLSGNARSCQEFQRKLLQKRPKVGETQEIYDTRTDCSGAGYVNGILIPWGQTLFL